MIKMKNRQLLESIQEGLTKIYDHIEEVYAPSRERSMAITKLDECLLWISTCDKKEGANANAHSSNNS